MALTMPSFTELIHYYPPSYQSFGVTHACAIRMSIALMNSVPNFLAEYTGRRHHQTGAATSARQLADYLQGLYVGWPPCRLGRGVAAHRAALELGTQGIIFWDVVSNDRQIQLRTNAETNRRNNATMRGLSSTPRSIHASPNHIDLWDPKRRTLQARQGRTMTWFPEATIVESAWFWEIPRLDSVGHK